MTAVPGFLQTLQPNMNRQTQACLPEYAREPLFYNLLLCELTQEIRGHTSECSKSVSFDCGVGATLWDYAVFMCDPSVTHLHIQNKCRHFNGLHIVRDSVSSFQKSGMSKTKCMHKYAIVPQRKIYEHEQKHLKKGIQATFVIRTPTKENKQKVVVIIGGLGCCH